jgi:hypothetical protein
MTTLADKLLAYQQANKLSTKGKLAAILFVTRLAKTKGLPLDSSALVTDSQGQVLGLGKSAVQSILKEHGESRILAEEGGRTSRGSLGNMQQYVVFLNALYQDGIVDVASIETWWVDRVRDFFSAKPFILRYDTSKLKWTHLSRHFFNKFKLSPFHYSQRNSAALFSLQPLRQALFS